VRTPSGRVVPVLRDYGGTCKLEMPAVWSRPTLLEGGSNSLHAYAVFGQEQDRLLTFPGLHSTDPNNSCKTLITDNQPGAPDYYASAPGHVSNLRPFDGSRTTWSVFAAQIFSLSTPETVESARRDWDKVMLCSLFLDGSVRAASQGIVYPSTAPATDVYITSMVLAAAPPLPRKPAVDDLRPGTILHEALHGLSGMGDRALSEFLMGHMSFEELTPEKRTQVRSDIDDSITYHITDFLEQRQCAPK
jgi:hypothetical protein